jgi:hypothetical protein
MLFSPDEGSLFLQGLTDKTPDALGQVSTSD